jgi:hypothetical protein
MNPRILENSMPNELVKMDFIMIDSIVKSALKGRYLREINF